MSNIKIMICDDHYFFREGVKHILNELSNLELIGMPGQGEEAIDLFNKGFIPDIIILDISMPPGVNGYEVAKFIQRNFPQTKVLICSSYCEEKAVLEMLRNGVKGFISKTSDKKIFFEAVDALCDGNYYIDGSLIINNKEDLYKGKNRYGLLSLTKRELEVALLMCSEKAYKQIADILKISPNTIENIRSRIFAKTACKSRTEVAILLMRVGLFN